MPCIFLKVPSMVLTSMTASFFFFFFFNFQSYYYQNYVVLVIFKTKHKKPYASLSHSAALLIPHPLLMTQYSTISKLDRSQVVDVYVRVTGGEVGAKVFLPKRQQARHSSLTHQGNCHQWWPSDYPQQRCFCQVSVVAFSLNPQSLWYASSSSM